MGGTIYRKQEHHYAHYVDGILPYVHAQGVIDSIIFVNRKSPDLEI